MTRPQAMERAREMYANGRNGWTITEVQRYLRRHDVTVSWWTVKHWVMPEYSEQERARQRAKERAARRATAGVRTIRFRVLDESGLMQRLRDLSAAGLSMNAARKVVNFDYGLDLSEHEVRDTLERGRVPVRYRDKAKAAA